MRKKYPFSNIFYLCLHHKLYEQCRRTKTISQKEFFHMLGVTYHIPKSCKLLVVKEMERLGMVVITNSQRQKFLEIQPKLTSPDEDAHKFYEERGIF